MNIKKDSLVRVIRFRISNDDFDRLSLEASACGIGISKFVRDYVLKERNIRPIHKVPEVNIEVYAELARLASNINQAVHHMNIFKDRFNYSDFERLEIMFKKAMNELQGLRNMLIDDSEYKKAVSHDSE